MQRELNAISLFYRLWKWRLCKKIAIATAEPLKKLHARISWISFYSLKETLWTRHKATTMIVVISLIHLGDAWYRAWIQ